MNDLQTVDVNFASEQDWKAVQGYIRDYREMILAHWGEGADVGVFAEIAMRGSYGEIIRVNGRVARVDGQQVTVAFSPEDVVRLLECSYLGPVVDVLKQNASGERPKGGAMSALGRGARRAIQQLGSGGPGRVSRPLVALAVGVLVLGTFLLFSGGDPEADADAEAAWPPPDIGGFGLVDLNLYRLTQELPDTPAGRSASWALATLNGALPHSSMLANFFSSDVLERMSPDELHGAIASFASEGPFRMVGLVTQPSETRIVLALESRPETFHALTVAVEAEEPHLVTELNVQNRRN